MSAVYLYSASGDPFYNLAVEEYILEHRTDLSPVLFIWQSDSAVIIGRHQNPWLEADTGLLTREGIVLARRMSGGGAVYQDRGNLNFAYIADRGHFDRDRQIRAVCECLSACGVNPTVGKRFGIYLTGRKISGSAFLMRRTRALHHGTLLVDADLSKMASLKGSLRITGGPGVRSEASDTTNIAAACPGVSVESIATGLRARFEEMAGCGFTEGDIGELCSGRAFSALLERHRSWDWRFGNTPPFDVELDDGGGQLSMHIEKGYVGPITIEPCGEVLFDGTGSVRFRAEEVRQALDGTGLRLGSLAGGGLF